MPIPTGPDTESAIMAASALADIAWMARRVAHQQGEATAQAFNEAVWLLHQHARRWDLSVEHPDPTANRDYAASGIVETPSHFSDGAPVEFAPEESRAQALEALDPVIAMQWVVQVVHPLAHTYADGRATYATSMFNEATRALRQVGFDLSATEAQGRGVFVADGMGDAYSGLSHAEAVERDTARAGLPPDEARG